MSPKPDSENKKANAATDDATGAGHVSVVHRPTKSPFLLWTVFAIFYTRSAIDFIYLLRDEIQCTQAGHGLIHPFKTVVLRFLRNTPGYGEDFPRIMIDSPSL